MRTSWINVIGAIVVLTLVMVLAEQDRPGAMAGIIVAGGMGLAFLNLDRLKSFKAGAFAAEMRQAVDEAHATVEQLRGMACSIAESTLTTLMAGNFMNGMTLADRLALHDKLVSSLSEIGVENPQIESVRQRWKNGVGVVYHRGVIHCLEQRKERSQVNFDASAEVRKAGADLQATLQFENWKALSADEMRAFIAGRNLMTDELAALLDDYAAFESTGELQRREVFLTL